jgi:hypothetical protein
MTLPGKEIAPDNTQSFYSVRVNSTDSADAFADLILLDTMGQTVTINENGAYVVYYQYYIDEPTTDRDLGYYLGTAFDRPQAVSVMDSAQPSGGPLTVDPGNNSLFAWCREGAPALTATYYPRWFIDRIQGQ